MANCDIFLRFNVTAIGQIEAMKLKIEAAYSKLWKEVEWESLIYCLS